MTILDRLARSLGFARPSKAETGPGVVPMMYDRHMSSLFEKDDQAKALAAQALYRINPWVNAAERVVTNAFANVEWHLEDEDDHEIGEESNPEQKAALDLIEHPQAALKKGETQKLSRRSLWTLTSRHMGLCGTSFWLGDGMSLDKIPTAFLYINPSRMTPQYNLNGYLIGWRLDAVPYDPDSGYPLKLDEVIQFSLDPADTGAWGIGLAETSGILAELWMLAARHSGGVLSSGGRIAGITMPKPGTEMSDEAWLALVRDMRTISEDPQAAKRNLIIKKPMDFMATAASPRELDLIASLAMSRDDILAFWGVPKSQLGMDVPSGLNSGTTKDRDKAVLWEGPVHARLTPFAEVIQSQVLDRWLARGVTVELEIEEPDFTEEKPKYEIAALALSQPLRNRERRAILGLDPFGDPALDEAVWMPLSITSQYTAPDAEGNPVEPLPEPEPPAIVAPPALPPILPEGKADTLRPLLGLRRAVNVKWTPRMQVAVAKVLDAQRAEIARRLVTNAAHIEAKPSDMHAWWDDSRWDAAMLEAVKPYVAAIAEQVSGTVADVLAPGKAATHLWAQPLFLRLLKAIGLRIVDINRRTRDRVQELIMAGIDEGQGPAQLGKMIREGVTLKGVPLFNELRAETIARTETMRTFNSAALQSYAEMGVTHVQPIDGDQDDMCRERIERGIVTLAEADADEEHPNGTLDWIPFDEGDARVPARVQETP
jgi:hypothetical protein